MDFNVIVFDGAVNYNATQDQKIGWTERAMSLFEDGDRLYNLKNGEIISVPRSVMFIETDSLENASPSLLSRMTTNICLT